MKLYENKELFSQLINKISIEKGINGTRINYV